MNRHTPGPWTVFHAGVRPGIEGAYGSFSIITYGDPGDAARSVRSYAQFKAAIAKAKEARP
jgi:hypothetical protein